MPCKVEYSFIRQTAIKEYLIAVFLKGKLTSTERTGELTPRIQNHLLCGEAGEGTAPQNAFV